MASPKYNDELEAAEVQDQGHPKAQLKFPADHMDKEEPSGGMLSCLAAVNSRMFGDEKV